VTGTIDTTLGGLAEAEPALARLAAIKLPYAAAYQVAKLTKAVAEELRHFHEQREALIREFGTSRPSTPDERARGGDETVIQVLASGPRWGEFLAQARELSLVPVTLQVPPFDLATVPNLEIAATDLLQLGVLVVGDDRLATTL